MLEDRDRTYTMEDIEQETGFDRRTIAYYVQEGLLPRVGRRGPRTRYPRHYLNRLLFIKKVRDLQDQGQLGNYTLEDIREIFETVPQRMIADIVSGKEPLEVAPYDGPARRRTALLGSPREQIERLRSLSERRRPPDSPRVPTAGSAPPASWSRHRLSRPVAVDDRSAGPAGPVAPDDASDGPGPREPIAAAPSPRSESTDDEALFLDLDTPHQELMVRRVVDGLAAPPASSRGVERRATPPPNTLARMLGQLDEAASREAPEGSAERWTRTEVTPDIVLTVRGLGEAEVQLLERIARVLRGMIEGRRGR